MPASTMEPITGALRNAFQGVKSSHCNGKSTSLESGLQAVTKKTHLAPVTFDPPVRAKQHHEVSSFSSTQSSAPSQYIVLNPGYSAKSNGNRNEHSVAAGNCNGQSKNGGDGEKTSDPTSPPRPKVTFCHPSEVSVGYKSTRTPGSGMINLSNTCYMNSALQALFHTPALYNYLTSNTHTKQCKAAGGLNGFFSASPCIICGMSLTLRDSLQSGVMRPNRIYDKLKMICKHFMHGRQEDAHEFLRYLIESLQRSYLQSVQAPKNLDTPSKETTPFNQIFGGYLRQDVTCLRCKNVSITFQHFMDVLLDIRQSSNVEDALANFFRPERIGGSGDSGEQTQNMYKCEKCNVKVPAKKKCFIERPPVVLCIQLKRFSLLGGKISKPVTLSRRIDVSRHVKRKESSPTQLPPLQYKLVSMITHVGPSPNCGHYTAIGEAGNGQFFQFDDSSVRPIPVQQALNTASYVVFYEMTRQTKQIWIDGNANSSVAPSSRLAGPSNKPATVTSNGHHAPSSPKTQTQLIGPQLPPSNNKLGVAVSASSPMPSPKSILKSGGLVPYGDEDGTTSEDDDPKEKESASSAINGHTPSPRPAGAVRAAPTNQGVGTAFVPRSVTMNALKNQDHPRPATPNTLAATAKAFQELRHSTTSTSTSGMMTCAASAASPWKVTDQETHNPSVDSNNSTGSTSSWKVTAAAASQVTKTAPPTPPPPRPPPMLALAAAVPAARMAFKPTPTPPPPPTIPPLTETAGAQQSLLKSSYPSSSASSQASTPLSVRLNSNGGLGSPERSLKRSGSMDEYETELDRGRAKKVKKHREPADSQSSLNCTSGNNPFQNYQNRSGSSGNGGDRHRSYSDSRPCAPVNRSWNGGGGGSGYSWQQQPHQQHRDHSYHSNNSFNNRGKYNGHSNSNFSASRRSYSSSSDYHRDQRHSGFKRRDSDCGGRGRSGGGGGNYYRDRKFRDHKR